MAPNRRDVLLTGSKADLNWADFEFCRNESGLPVIVDGAVCRDQEVFRALAFGASVIALGRPLLCGSALGGARGVQSVHAHLQAGLVMAMQLGDTPTIKRSRATLSPTPKRTAEINARQFASREAVRGIMSPAKLADSQTHERANDLKNIQGYQGAQA